MHQYQHPTLVSLSIPGLNSVRVPVKYMPIPRHHYQLYVYLYDNFVELCTPVKLVTVSLF